MTFPSANILTKALLDQMTDVAFIKDQNRRYIYGNNAFAVLLGKPLTDIIGFDDSTLFPPEFSEKFWKMDDQVLSSGEQITFEEDVMSASGEVILMMTKKMRIEIDGKFYLLGITRDVTEFNKTLHLNQMSKLSSGLAHELLTPLTVMNFNILKATDLMQKDAFDKAAAENFLSKMRIVEKRLTDTVQAVQAFAVQARVQPTVRKKLPELLEEVRELVGPRLKARQVEMHEFSALPVEILSRGTQISQVLVNLIQNAADAVAALPERWVKLEFKSLHGSLEIRVIDSGNGIQPEIAKKLMEPFFTTKTGGAGTGLGLSLAARIVADHHGELFYDAAAPHTTFVLRLPLAA
jgi:PAS domain S-box-containing protein